MTVERGERWQRPEPDPYELTSVYLERMVDSLEEYANELFEEIAEGFNQMANGPRIHPPRANRVTDNREQGVDLGPGRRVK